MTPAGQIGARGRADGALRLEDLIPIAVVIAAGCESCTDSMVKRALRNGAARSEIERTLKIVTHLRRADCFKRAVGEELTARMDVPLAAGARALSEQAPASEPELGACCGPRRAATPQAPV
jgi:AhpD family alkylhydroperoxidase